MNVFDNECDYGNKIDLVLLFNAEFHHKRQFNISESTLMDYREYTCILQNCEAQNISISIGILGKDIHYGWVIL